MDVVPRSVGVAAQAWDEQHLDLDAAARQVAGVGSGGFTSPVSGTAARFLTAWERHLTALGGRAEARADGLRVAIVEYVSSDEAAFESVAQLMPFVQETR